jgi:hypothetical protein
MWNILICSVSIPITECIISGYARYFRWISLYVGLNRGTVQSQSCSSNATPTPRCVFRLISRLPTKPKPCEGRLALCKKPLLPHLGLPVRRNASSFTLHEYVLWNPNTSSYFQRIKWKFPPAFPQVYLKQHAHDSIIFLLRHINETLHSVYIF